jgi:hypothetical protein
MRTMNLARLRSLDLRTDVLPFVVATAGEFTALFFWLFYLDQGRFWLANGILWGGFLVERTAVIVWIRYIYRSRQQKVKTPSLLITVVGLLGITLTEILIWVLWLAMADGTIAMIAMDPATNFILAAVVLMVLMQAEHSVEMAGLKQKKWTIFFTDPKTIFFTFMEVAGAVAWLYMVRTDRPILGALFLLLGLSIEHVLQGSDLRPEEVEAAELEPGAVVATDGLKGVGVDVVAPGAG